MKTLFRIHWARAYLAVEFRIREHVELLLAQEKKGGREEEEEDGTNPLLLRIDSAKKSGRQTLLRLGKNETEFHRILWEFSYDRKKDLLPIELVHFLVGLFYLFSSKVLVVAKKEA